MRVSRDNGYALAKERLPLKRLIEQYGHAPKNQNWKSFPECPFCRKRGCAGVNGKAGFDTFKCFHDDCPTGKDALNEIAYVAQVEGLSTEGKPSPAFKRYLELAGTWQEPVARPQGTKKKAAGDEGSVQRPTPKAERPEWDGKGEPPSRVLEELLPLAIDVVRDEMKASVSLIQRRLRCGYAMAQQLIDAMEAQKLVGPSRGTEPREVFLEHAVLSEAQAAKLQGLVAGDKGKETSSIENTAGDGKVVEVRFKAERADEAAQLNHDESGVESGGGGHDDRGGDDGHGDGDDGGLRPGARLLQAFYESLTLTDEDVAELEAKRGLTRETVVDLGLRSNLKSNRTVLEALQQRYDVEEVEGSGLYVRDRSGQWRPSGQFYGYGLKGKDAKGEDVWDWTFPVLIPYFNLAGRLTYLRPHKGGMKDKPPRVYCACPQAAAVGRYELAVVTEGEFKAGAGYQVFATGSQRVLWLAVPGISQVKNWSVWAELLGMLQDSGVRNVVVAFDNEEKGDPQLAGYKADKRKRFDTVVWARYLAERLVNEGLEARVCMLPVELRDAKGKADWDGILAQQRQQKLAAEKIRELWWRWLRGSQAPKEWKQAGLFAQEEERIIASRLAQLWYKPALPYGGDKERSTAYKLKKLAYTTLKGVPGVRFLADRYMAVPGWYYKVDEPDQKTRASIFRKLTEAEKAEDKDMEWFLRLQLEGVPKPVADFRMDLKFVLVRHDGRRDRIVDITNAQGEKWPGLVLDSRSFTRPTEFREWLCNTCNATWMDGERPLQQLMRDVNHAAQGMEVHQVTAWGWHEASKIWFFGDCAVAPDGTILYAGEDGVYWHDGLGYLVSEKDHEGENYRQGRPRLQPGLNLDEVKIEFAHRSADGDGAVEVAPVLAGELGLTLDDVRGEARITAFFQEFTQRAYETLGGYEAFMAVGLTLAYAAAPEIFEEWKAFPGQWAHGQMGQGKTSFAMWMMGLTGFDLDKGLNIRTKGCSEVGMLIAAQQYSNLPVWFEEFRLGEVDKGKEGVLHAGFNRDTQSKKTVDGNQRQIRAGFIVTGESTSNDAATRSRYGHYQVAEAKRLGDHYAWMNRHMGQFVVFFRELLKRRKEYAGLTMGALKQWMASPDMRNVDARSRLVHGVAFAAMTAAVGLLQSHPPEVMTEFRRVLLGHCVEAVAQVKLQVNIEVFWQDLLAGYKLGAFGHNLAEKRQYFKVVATNMEYAPLQPGQKLWVNYQLYINYGIVLPALREWLRKQNRVVPLEINDLSDQLKQTACWVGKSRQRFDKDRKSADYCWQIDLDRHELGYRTVDDDELERSRWKNESVRLSSDNWSDPRHGELHAIALELEEKPELNI